MNQISTTATINPTPNAEVTAMAAISAWLRPLGAPEFGMVVGASVGLEVTSSAILEDVALPSAEAPLAAANAWRYSLKRPESMLFAKFAKMLSPADFGSLYPATLCALTYSIATDESDAPRFLSTLLSNRAAAFTALTVLTEILVYSMPLPQQTATVSENVSIFIGVEAHSVESIPWSV
jgi:hypothetical protein